MAKDDGGILWESRHRSLYLRAFGGAGAFGVTRKINSTALRLMENEISPPPPPPPSLRTASRRDVSFDPLAFALKVLVAFGCLR